MAAADAVWDPAADAHIVAVARARIVVEEDAATAGVIVQAREPLE